MPRKPREVRRPSKDKDKPTKTQRVEVGIRPTHAHEVLRFRCPVCGMMPLADRLEGAPYELALYLQRFGGRLPGGKVGYMEYVPLIEPAEIETFLELELLPVLKQVCSNYEKNIVPVSPAPITPKPHGRIKKL